jgi:hypothetical protein
MPLSFRAAAREAAVPPTVPHTESLNPVPHASENAVPHIASAN